MPNFYVSVLVCIFVLGGGRPAFFPPKKYKEKYKYEYKPETWDCKRVDNEDLIEKWLKNHENAKFVDNAEDFRNVDPGETEFLMGLFSEHHIPYIDQRDPQIHPNLVEMTQKAIEILKNEQNGFFLMVEAARIDTGKHL